MNAIDPYILPAMIAALGWLIRREFAKLDATLAAHGAAHANTRARLIRLEARPPCPVCPDSRFLDDDDVAAAPP